ncbi:TPA: hypothetical protein QHX44_002197 [Klebsiella oxytoca]|uniref:hypothetical protein n=1 Tax=Klebsiella oxytoca TaxID=571 RepID=UPI00277B9AE1|nr:hypothetical protein [Klebsiella oxytoca]
MGKTENFLNVFLGWTKIFATPVSSFSSMKKSGAIRQSPDRKRKMLNSCTGKTDAVDKATMAVDEALN